MIIVAFIWHFYAAIKDKMSLRFSLSLSSSFFLPFFHSVSLNMCVRQEKQHLLSTHFIEFVSFSFGVSLSTHSTLMLQVNFISIARQIHVHAH